MVNTGRTHRQQAGDILCRRRVRDSAEALRTHGARDELVAPDIVAIRGDGVVFGSVLLLRDRKEHSARVGEGAALLPCAGRDPTSARDRAASYWRYGLPEVVATDSGLETGAQGCIAVVLAELEQLVDLALAVTEIGSLRVSQVNAQALSRAMYLINISCS